MYQTLAHGDDVGKRHRLTLAGERTVYAPNAEYGEKPERYHLKAMLEFAIHNNALLDFEETRKKHREMQKLVLGPRERR